MIPLPLSLTIIFSLLRLSLAAHPPNPPVTWLYPPPASHPLTFNALDTVNVSWISAHTPASLTLACQNNNNNNDNNAESTPALHLRVPATGSRLISLAPASQYRTCCFEISSSSNHHGEGGGGAIFSIINDESLPPFFRTLASPPSFSSSNDGTGTAPQATSPEEGKNSKTTCDDGKKPAAVVIGVAVAVGGFAAMSAAAYLSLGLLRGSRRSRSRSRVRARGGGKGKGEGEGEVDKGSKTREWVFGNDEDGGAEGKEEEKGEGRGEKVMATEEGIVRGLQREDGGWGG